MIACWPHVLYSSLRDFSRADCEILVEYNVCSTDNACQSVVRPMMAREMETCLIYRIYEYLCVLKREGTNHLFLIFTRKDSFDQGNALKRSICKSNQSPARCSVTVERKRDRGGIGIPENAELTKGTYHSRG